MTVEFKETIWLSIEVETEEEEKKILDSIKNGEINTAEDLCSSLDVGATFMEETSTPVDPIDNNGWATIEVKDDEGNTVYANGRTS